MHFDENIQIHQKHFTFSGGGYNKITKFGGGINIRIILDTDKKTITVPWNYQDKLNEMIEKYGGAGAEKKTFKGFINEIWEECMADSDKHVVTGKKPAKPDKKG